MQVAALLKDAMAFMTEELYDKALIVLDAALGYGVDDVLRAEIYFQSGLCRYRLQEYEAAAVCLEAALNIAQGAPLDKEYIYELLRMAYKRALKFDKLADVCLQILDYFNDVDVLKDLVVAYRKSEKWDEAVKALDKLLTVDMNEENLMAKITCLTKLVRTDQAISAAHEYIERFGESDALCYSLASLYFDIGESVAAMEYFKRFLGKTNDPARLFTMRGHVLAKNLYADILSKEEYIGHIEAMRRDSGLLEINKNFKNELKPFKKLRLGYLSADLYAHPIGYFLSPVMGNTVTSHSFIKCYSDTPHRDLCSSVTHLIKENADEWADVYERPDSYIEEMFLNDGIDIAFDMMCHSKNNRLLLHARRLAPVQISWIGLPVTTAVHAMDYVITDKCTDPPGIAEKYYTEKLLYMPDTYLCHILNGVQTPSTPAFDRNGYITFACFHNMEKITDETLRLWRRILKLVENSVMIVMGRMPGDDGVCDRLVIDRFKCNNMPMDRITILPMRPIDEYLNAYNNVDIMLDTYPFNGATTTFDAFKMGRPIVTLAGEQHVTRVGYGMLKNVGLEELAAFTEDEYVEKAVMLANNPERLRRISRELPERIKNSALTDQIAFKKNYEKIIRDAWVEHCVKNRLEAYDYKKDDLQELLEQVTNATIYLERKLEAGEGVAELLIEYHLLQMAFLGKIRSIVADKAFVSGYEKLVDLIGCPIDEKTAKAAFNIAKKYLNVICDAGL